MLITENGRRNTACTVTFLFHKHLTLPVATYLGLYYDLYIKHYQQDSQSSHNVTLRHFRANIVAAKKQKVGYITYSSCVFVDFGIQHAMRMCHFVICGLPGYAAFFHISHKRHDFQNEKIC